MEDITSIKDKLAFGQVPLFEHDGMRLVQSMAICRYIARVYGMYGKDAKEASWADMIIDGVNDFNAAKSAAKTDEDKAKFTSETLPKWLGYFENLLKGNNNGQEFFVGNSVTIADIMVYCLLAYLVQSHHNALDHSPLLKAHFERISNRPKIAHWVRSRPQTNW